MHFCFKAWQTKMIDTSRPQTVCRRQTILVYIIMFPCHLDTQFWKYFDPRNKTINYPISKRILGHMVLVKQLSMK